MSLLPFAEQVFANDCKFRDYCLNPDHPIGKNKAQAFASVFGITLENWVVLRDAVLDAVRSEPAIHKGRNRYGEIYVVEFIMHYASRSALIRSSWIVHDDENFPRLTSCYITD